MITINDNDLPITVAEKIINGTRPFDTSPMIKKAAQILSGNEKAGETQDMFDINEIKEIADYLMLYYEHHNHSD